MSYLETLLVGLLSYCQLHRTQISEEEVMMSGNEARPGADSFSFCMLRIIQISVILSCIIVVTESTSFQISISTGFPTLPFFCLPQLGPSGHFPRCSRVCVWEKRGRKREKKMREMDANWHLKFALNSWNGVKSFLGFFTTCTVEFTVWACVCGCFAISLKSL